MATAQTRDIAGTEKAATKRKAPPSLSSLPAPKAGGPLRILLVDDDWSDNNGPGGTGRLSGSDEVYRELVAAAVGGQAKSWSVEVVERYKNGPSLERLRDFNVILWFTGGSYGGGYDNSAVLSVEDEKTARRYLEEVGGAFILVSPGYVNNLSYGSTWTDSPNPFLKEVIGINGFSGLVQRFTEGSVQAADGSSYTVAAKGAAETQFSAVNSSGSAVVFTASLDPKKTAASPVPVAVANSYGGGRFVYVGFTFENIPANDRARAFGALLNAATGAPPSGATASAPTVMGPKTVVSASPTLQTIKEAPPGPPPTNLRITSHRPSWHEINWNGSGVQTYEVYRRDPDGWRFVSGEWRWDVDGGIRTVFHDGSLVAPNSAYKVVSVYADGRRGEAVVEYPNPPQPRAPTRLKAYQVGPGTIQVEWTNVPDETWYRITMPAFSLSARGGKEVTTPTNSTTGSGTVDKLPLGVHEIRVAVSYKENQPIPVPYATIKVAVNSDRGRYRMLFLGAKVNQPVDDDVLDLDGKGNEIFAGAYWATIPRGAALGTPATGGGFARSVVYGSTQGFADRVRAGTAGPNGGLRAGDYVPAQAALLPQLGVAAQTDRFPLLLWEGELVDGGPLVAVVPIMFEWSAPNHPAWSYWADWWSSRTTGTNVILKNLGDKMREFERDPLGPKPLHGTWSIEDFSKRRTDAHEQAPLVPEFSVGAGKDHPIGLIITSRPGYEHTYGHKPLGYVLTHTNIEGELGGLVAKVIQLNWSDAQSGDYTGYIQIERTSEPPYVAPAEAPGLEITSTTLPMPTVIGVGTGTPTPPPAAPPVTTPRVTEQPNTGPNRMQTITPQDAPPPGPPPTELEVHSSGPVFHTLTWRWPPEGGMNYEVFRKEGDRWISVMASTPTNEAHDRSFVAPNTVYQVVAHYPDGRAGSAEITFPNPRQPRVVTALAAAQTGDGNIQLTWKAALDSFDGFRVFAPGLPAEGKLVGKKNGTDYSTNISGLPLGLHRFRVAYQYDGKVAPVDATVTGAVGPPEGEYRLVLLGFRVDRKTTDDDIFDGDGRGDEVFFAGYRATISAGEAPPVSLGFLESAVMGDTNRFPNRVQTGNAGPTGGIRSGDAIPSESALTAQPGIAVTSDRLPMLLWSGHLTNQDLPIAVALTAFEWDNSSTAALNTWKNWWSAPNGVSGLRAAARAALAATPDEVRFVALTGTYDVTPENGTARTPKVKQYYSTMMQGRPIGTRPIGAMKSVDPTYWYCVPYGFAFSRNALEKMLGSKSAVVISASLTMQKGPEVDDPAQHDEARYTIYVQIERTSAPPPSVGP